MNPYRSDAPSPQVQIRRAHPAARRKTIGFLLVTAALCSPMFVFIVGPWVLVPAALAALVGIALATIGRSRTPLTRLCSLVWNRGDRFGAAMLFFNVTAPRYSAKRIARNRAAVAAVTARCVQYPRNPINDFVVRAFRGER